MSRRGRIFAIIIIVIAVAAVAVFATIQRLGRRIPMGDASMVGNAAGNLYNGGYFCEQDGKVYFSNLSDSGCLYSMDLNETGFKKLSTISARNILCGGNFLYLYMDSSSRSVTQGLGAAVREYGIYRMRNDGKYATCLLREVVEEMQLGGSYIYYRKGDDMSGTLERIRVDKRERTGYGNTPSFYQAHINPAAYSNGSIYYSGVQGDHSLYRLNVEGTTPVSQMVYQGNVYQPIFEGSVIYYLDALNNYRITSFNIVTGQTQVLSTHGADAYNLNGTYIFYDTQEADTPGLYRMRLDGSDVTLIAAGACNSLHLTSANLYFRMYGADGVYYHLPLSGASAPSVFMPETTN